MLNSWILFIWEEKGCRCFEGFLEGGLDSANFNGGRRKYIGSQLVGIVGVVFKVRVCFKK